MGRSVFYAYRWNVIRGVLGLSIWGKDLMQHLGKPEWRVWVQLYQGNFVAFCGTYYECKTYALKQTAYFRIEKVRT
jgi:hypothetical protein